MSKRRRDTANPSGPPDAAALHEAALNYLARYAATEVALRRTLDRRIDRWARAAGAEASDADAIARSVAAAREAAHGVVARLAAAGAVSDAAFAESKARSLARSGRSRRAIGAHLAAKGVGIELQRQVLGDNPESEFAAALVLCKRRRIGPFRAGAPPDATGRHRELGMLARAGFSQPVARRALDTPRDEADELVNALRR